MKSNHRSMWNNLPHQQLHHKLDILEKDFLNTKTTRSINKK